MVQPADNLFHFRYVYPQLSGYLFVGPTICQKSVDDFGESVCIHHATNFFHGAMCVSCFTFSAEHQDEYCQSKDASRGNDEMR